MNQYVIGIDVGTSESKGVLCALDGRIVASAACAHGLILPKPGYAEHDPVHTWWEDVCELSRALVNTPGVSPHEIQAICCSAISCAVTAVGEDGLPLRNAILYGIDTRAEAERILLEEQIGADTILARCGEVMSMDSYGPKVYWIRRNEPEIYEKTAFFTFAQGYINYRLTGNNYIDSYSVFFSTPLYNYHTKTWDEITAPYVCDMGLLPKIANPSDIIGHVTTQAALETGLPEGIPVLCGATDAGAEALSVGVSKPGDMMVMYGSTIYINGLTDRLYVQDNPLWKGYYLFPGTCCVMAGMSTTGILTAWLRDEMARELVEAEIQGGKNAYQAMFETTETIPAGSQGVYVLPYFMGERMPLKDPNAKGLIFGLTTSHTRAHIIKAALEGIGYGLEQNISIMQNLGLEINEITAVGGGTKSPQWMQIMSDITGIPQRIPSITLGASFGDAMLCALALNEASLEDVKQWNQTARRIAPNPDTRETYQKGKLIFKALYESTKELMHLV